MSSVYADVEKEAVTDAVWLRAATGGIVCSGTQGRQRHERCPHWTMLLQILRSRPEQVRPCFAVTSC